MLRSYTVQIKATKKQCERLASLMDHLCELYNAALQERRDAWKICRKNVSCYEQYRELTELRKLDAESASFPATIQRDPIKRVQRAFDGFFRRCRNGETPGFPRFRSRHRYDSFAVDSQNFRIENSTIVVVRLGGFRFKTRCRIRGNPKVVNFKRVAGRWMATITCEIGPPPSKVSVSSAIGIDLGLTSLVTLSDGSEVDNPKWQKNQEIRLSDAQRRLAKKKFGSNNRLRAKERVRRIHQQTRSRRRSYLHQVSRFLVSNYDLIAYEKLNIRALSRLQFGKSIMDAAWGELIWQLTYKAEEAGKYAVAVDPRGTSQKCSGCNEKVPKGLFVRHHLCPHCGLSLGRDHNAALNILALGESVVGVTTKCP